jgi:hypothetical protein
MEGLRRGVGSGVDLEAGDGGVPARGGLGAETAHLHLAEPGEFAREVLDVNARAPVDVGREFVGEEESLHPTRARERF